MMGFIEAAATSHSLSLAAMEEASRTGDRVAEVEHLLLALTITDHPAGQVLRGLGATLDATRDAVAAQHAAQLASIGIDAGTDGAEIAGPGRIVFHETGGYAWGERPLAVFKRACDRPGRGNSSAVLRELLSDPSGMIGDVLRRLGIEPRSIIDRLDEIERVATAVESAAPGSQSQRPRAPGSAGAPPPTTSPSTPESTNASPSASGVEYRSNRAPGGDGRVGVHRPAPAPGPRGTATAFVPAPLEPVWELLADPARMPDWDPGVASCDAADPVRVIGASWEAQTLTRRPDGTDLRVAPTHRRRIVAITAFADGRLLEWLTTFPDDPAANSRRVRIALEPAAGGTQLRLALAWERREQRAAGPLRGLLFRPFTRFAIRMQLSQLGAGIARAFR